QRHPLRPADDVRGRRSGERDHRRAGLRGGPAGKDGGTVSDEVLTERAGNILIIILNRPEVRNAVNEAVAHAVAAAADLLDDDPGLVLGIITGAGGTFCAGMDLKAFLRGEVPRIEGRGLAGIAITPPRKPLIAAVEGHAVAGGCEIALACDLIVA